MGGYLISRTILMIRKGDKNMKKLFVVMMVLMMAFSLTACGGEEKVEDTKMVCTTTTNGVEVMNEIVANGNKVKTVSYNNTLEVDDSMAEMLESAAQAYVEKYNAVKGVEYTFEIKDGKFVEKTFIDFTTADMSALCDAGLLEKVDGQVPDYIDLEKTLEGMKASGCECK